MINLLCLVIGFIVGMETALYIERRIKEASAKLEKTAAPAVTLGSYKPANENFANQEESHIVEPKTPQQLAWEAERKLDKQNNL